MKPLLPGALELPNDKYRFRIDELEKKVEQYADENARYADENARYADEITRLKKGLLSWKLNRHNVYSYKNTRDWRTFSSPCFV